MLNNFEQEEFLIPYRNVANLREEVYLSDNLDSDRGDGQSTYQIAFPSHRRGSGVKHKKLNNF